MVVGISAVTSSGSGMVSYLGRGIYDISEVGAPYSRKEGHGSRDGLDEKGPARRY